MADDASTDGTWAWCVETEKHDPNFKWTRNMGPDRVGLTKLYNRLVEYTATHEICMIFHADMYLCPGALDAIEKHIGLKKIVSLTRIEPSLHPPGPEKILRDFGIEPEMFNEDYLLRDNNILLQINANKTSEGIFAPWVVMKSDFMEINGHDELLFSPQSKEDSDIFNRFQLNGVSFIQTWEGYVYHMTCRGSRFNPTLTTPGQNSQEWEIQNVRSSRNFIRKWGHFVKHDEMMKPIIPPKYDIGFIIYNCNEPLLNALEPWCSTVYVDCPIDAYIWQEQPNTKFNLIDRIQDINATKHNNILVTIDGAMFGQNDMNVIMELATIIQQTNDVGEFELGNLKIQIERLTTFEHGNIVCENNKVV